MEQKSFLWAAKSKAGQLTGVYPKPGLFPPVFLTPPLSLALCSLLFRVSVQCFVPAAVSLPRFLTPQSWENQRVDCARDLRLWNNQSSLQPCCTGSPLIHQGCASGVGLRIISRKHPPLIHLNPLRRKSAYSNAAIYILVLFMVGVYLYIYYFSSFFLILWP